MSTDDKTDDSLIYYDSLQKIAKGASIVFIGLLVSLVPIFIGKLIVIRYWTENEYGIFSLAFTILIIISTLSTLGLGFGVSLRIAYVRGRKEYKKIPDLIFTSILICLIVSISLGFITFLLSEIIAEYIFHESILTIPLKIFSIAIPFLTLINVIVAIFRGFDEVKPTVIFHQIMWNSFFPVFLIAVIYFNKNFINIFYAYLASIIITCIILIFYSFRFIHTIYYTPKRFLKSKFSKELLIFSLPLFGTAVLNLLITWTDTLMLGGIKGSFDVGLYNGALPLAIFITFPLTALITIFMPIFSGLYAKNLLNEIKRNFSIVTKWLCLATLPIFLILFFYPEQLLNFLFGSSYIVAANALRILAIGFIINNFLGPNGATLMVMGKTLFIMFATLTTAALNIVLNVILIPYYGIIGAALASAIALISLNLIKGYKLYSKAEVHPLSKNIIKPTLLSLIVIIGLYFVLNNYFTVDIWILPILFGIYYFIYIAAILFTKSVDQEDLKMLEVIEQKTGFRSRLIKKLIYRFL